MLLTLVQCNFNPLIHNEVGPIDSISKARAIINPKMDFEKEMQKSLKVIRQNIQALNGRDKTPIDLNDSRMSVKQSRHTLILPAQGTSAKFVQQQITHRERSVKKLKDEARA